jgi:hypothetical protein
MDCYSYPDTNNSTKHQPGATLEASVDPYDADMTPSIQEALHRSNMDVRYQKIVYLISPVFFFLRDMSYVWEY